MPENDILPHHIKENGMLGIGKKSPKAAAPKAAAPKPSAAEHLGQHGTTAPPSTPENVASDMRKLKLKQMELYLGMIPGAHARDALILFHKIVN